MAKAKAKVSKARRRVEPRATLPAMRKGRGSGLIPTAPPAPWVAHVQTMANVSRMKRAGVIVNPFAAALPEPPPGVLPAKKTAKGLAMDAGLNFEANTWAASQVYSSAFFNGVQFMGYTYLSELAQRPEYRHISEALAIEMTRKWIRLITTNQDEAKQKQQRIQQLKDRMEALNVQGACRKMTELDGFFGRGHLYIDTGDTDNLEELQTDIGDGENVATLAKYKGKKNFLVALRPVEPVWCYPARYNANDPLKSDWYNPKMWFCQGKEIHSSRLMPFVGREVPDILKPSYSFGGLSLSQMAKPYVDNFLRTRQSVADLIWSFSVMVLKTDLATLAMDDGSDLFDRIELFNNFRTNQGTFLLDKNTEDFSNVSVPLGTLDHLQAQSQEQMCSVTGTPVVKLLGIQPSGLNASSEGELKTWADRVAAYQKKFYFYPLRKIIHFIMLDLWGETDPGISFEFEPLEELNAKEKADVDKTKADTDVALVGAGILAPEESRQRLAMEPDSPYGDIDAEDVPENPMGMEPGEDDDIGGMFGSEERPGGNGRAPGGEGRESDDNRNPDRGGDRDSGSDDGGGRSPSPRTSEREPAERKREPREFE